MKSNISHSMSHIGLTVPDMDHAIQFYSDVFGVSLLKSPMTVIENEEGIMSKTCQDIFGTGWKELKMAHLTGIGDVALELFEFPYKDQSNADYKPFQSGFFHLGIRTANVEELVEKLEKNGGKRRMPIREIALGEESAKICYVEDPFGIVFEIQR